VGADFGVVGLVLVRVDGVVAQRPRHTSQIHPVFAFVALIRQRWHAKDSQGRFLVLAFRKQSFKLLFTRTQL